MDDRVHGVQSVSKAVPLSDGRKFDSFIIRQFLKEEAMSQLNAGTKVS